jgi:hypothetical protein
LPKRRRRTLPREPIRKQAGKSTANYRPRRNRKMGLACHGPPISILSSIHGCQIPRPFLSFHHFFSLSFFLPPAPLRSASGAYNLACRQTGLLHRQEQALAHKQKLERVLEEDENYQDRTSPIRPSVAGTSALPQKLPRTSYEWYMYARA